MMLDWDLILDQLLYLKKTDTFSLDNLHDLTIDTLHGSMFGLNIRYLILNEAIFSHKRNIVGYSIKRIKSLLNEPDFTFKEYTPPRAQVGLGTYGWKYDSNIIETAIKYGVSLIDTAAGYGYGKVETELGNVINGLKSVDVYTKVRRDHMSSSAITNSVNRSISKLKIKPHVQLHYPHDKHVDAILELSNFQMSGKIKSIGLGNCSVDMIESTQRALTEYNCGVINSVQIRFNLIDQRIKNTIIPYCAQRGISIIAYSPLGQNFKDLNSDVLKGVAKRYMATPSQVALSWILSHPGIIPIPRTNNIKHLNENLESNNLKLDSNDILLLENYYSNTQIK